MTHYAMAVPAAVLLVSFSISSAGQTTTDDSASSTYVAPVQTPAQVSTAQKQLSAEEMADILMARKE